MSEPIPVKVTRYACPYCYYSRARKRATVEHIARCWRNPDVGGGPIAGCEKSEAAS